jgi:sentrin-specific protease 1
MSEKEVKGLIDAIEGLNVKEKSEAASSSSIPSLNNSKLYITPLRASRASRQQGDSLTRLYELKPVEDGAKMQDVTTTMTGEPKSTIVVNRVKGTPRLPNEPCLKFTPIKESQIIQSGTSVVDKKHMGLSATRTRPKSTEQERESFVSEKDLIDERLRDLSTEDGESVENFFRLPFDDTVVQSKFNFEMKAMKMECLGPRQWLNDEIVNFYMELLAERDSILCQKDSKRRRSVFYNSFFIDRLCNSGHAVQGEAVPYCYSNVRRWSRKKKVDMFDVDKIICPVNLDNMHWALIVIFVQHCRICYYDSMGGSDRGLLKLVMRYMQDESRDKRGREMDTTNWSTTCSTSPTQCNGFDCGVFAIMNADFLSDDLPLEYSQQHMPLFRRKVCANILRGKLNYKI